MDELLRAGTMQKFGKKEQGSFPRLKSAQPQPNNSSLSTGHKVMIMQQKQAQVTSTEKTILDLDAQFLTPLQYLSPFTLYLSYLSLSISPTFD